MYHSINSILHAVAEGRELTASQVECVKAKLERDAERNRQRAIMRKARKESFEREIMDILESAPNTGFTATDVQFLIQNFTTRYITNQKIASYLRGLMDDGKITRARINGNRMTVFYCGNDLLDLYRRYPIRSIDNIYPR